MRMVQLRVDRALLESHLPRRWMHTCLRTDRVRDEARLEGSPRMIKHSSIVFASGVWIVIIESSTVLMLLYSILACQFY